LCTVRQKARGVRLCLARVLVLLCASLMGTGLAVAQAPVVPIASFLHHWDHHWYVWLVGDPVYEAVEVMASERGPERAPLVWVFFTERAVPKRQIHYYNDPQVAASVGAM
jgi:hypothetical protein